MQIITDIEQGTEEWKNLRLGVITASRFKDVLAKGSGATRTTYIHQLAAEIITGEVAEFFSNDAMKWGTETEPQARAMYELRTGYEVEEVAFIKMDDHNVGVSPDGIIDNVGLVEFKCPKTTTQIKTFLGGKMPTCHIPQVQGQMWVSNTQWCDFVSFDPRINGEASWFKIRIKRDEEYIKDMQEKIFKFEDELNNLVKVLRG